MKTKVGVIKISFSERKTKTITALIQLAKEEGNQKLLSSLTFHKETGLIRRLGLRMVNQLLLCEIIKKARWRG